MLATLEHVAAALRSARRPAALKSAVVRQALGLLLGGLPLSGLPLRIRMGQLLFGLTGIFCHRLLQGFPDVLKAFLELVLACHSFCSPREFANDLG